MFQVRAPRDNTSLLVEWWRTIDRVLPALFFGLLAVGLVLTASSAPGLWPAQLKYALLSFLIAFAVSVLSLKTLRRAGSVLFVIVLCLLAATPVAGSCVKGACRWIYGLQPSEFIKPTFVIFTAWMFSLIKEDERRKLFSPAVTVSFGALGVLATILVAQPDYGQTFLIGSVWTMMFFAGGAHWLWFAAIGGGGVLGAFGAYTVSHHVRERVDGFLFPDSGDRFGVNYQTAKAGRAVEAGGIFGRGPGEGSVTRSLPEAHNDFIFSVAAEEFGFILCLGVIIAYAVIVFRCMRFAAGAERDFIRVASVGLASLIGLQAFINMAVNVGLFPPKGMTLPFISYGGSSLVALGFTAGALICLTRKRPGGVYDV